MKQYNNNAIPRTKKSKNRAKKRGPIIAAIRNHNLIESVPPWAPIITISQT